MSNIWKYTTAILAILVVVSIATRGFSSLGKATLGSVIDDLNSLEQAEQNTQVKTALNDALSTLQSVEITKTTVTGNAEGTVLVQEFSDFQCPYCRRAYPTVEQFRKDYAGKITFEYHHFPLSSIHPYAEKAAEAAECARDQGKFEEFYNTLFTNSDLTVDAIKGYAKDMGLDTAKFNSCLDNGDKASVVQADFDKGRSLGVTGTPTFFINGQKVVGAQPYENFASAIDKALSGDTTAAQPATTTTTPTQPTTTDVTAKMGDDPVEGSDSAKVVIVEWSDFQCPYCGRFFSQTYPSIKKDYIDTGKVRLVYRDFPLTSIHPNAAPAAQAAQCAYEQGKFWEYHNKLFENQQTLSSDNYVQWADDLGLDMTKFNACIATQNTAEWQADETDGQAAGVTGTPGFVIGIDQGDGTVVGEPIKGAQPYSVFQAAIERQLAKV